MWSVKVIIEMLEIPIAGQALWESSTNQFHDGGAGTHCHGSVIDPRGTILKAARSAWWIIHISTSTVEHHPVRDPTPIRLGPALLRTSHLVVPLDRPQRGGGGLSVHPRRVNNSLRARLHMALSPPIQGTRKDRPHRRRETPRRA
jgi:hypothetical protein